MKVSVIYSTESNWVGYPIEENIEGENCGSFDVLRDFICRKRNSCGVLLAN